MIRTPRQYADDIEALTALINESEIFFDLCDEATKRCESEAEELVKELKENHADLFELMEEFYNQYDADGKPWIFYGLYNDYMEDYLVRFSVEKIDIMCFVLLLIFSQGRVSGATIFRYPDEFADFLYCYGYHKLAEFQQTRDIKDTDALSYFLEFDD